MDEVVLTPMQMGQLSTAAIHPDLMDRWLNRIHCGDCINLMNEMPAESLDLIVTSPPYNMQELGHLKRIEKRKRRDRAPLLA